MIKRIIVLVLALHLLQPAWAQANREGSWQGKLSVSGMSVRLVVHLTNASGAWVATMDSPDQGAKGIPVSRTVVTADSLLLDVAAVGGKLRGRFTTDSTFSGQWVQGISLPLELKKLRAGEGVAEAKRPQSPRAPFSYKSDSVLYKNRDGSIQYGATVTSPQGAGPFPAMVFITGSGQQNRDEELFGHRPFAVLADHLTRQGYVVLRVDDRSVGQSTGDVKNATSKDFATDVMTSLDYLKSLPQVDKSKTGLLGHSEGGLIAQLVAAERNDIAFVVSLAGPGQNILDLMTNQNAAVLQSASLSKSAVEAYIPLFRSLMMAVMTPESDSAAKAAGLPLVETWLRQTPDSLQAAYRSMNASGRPADFLNGMIREIRSPWFRYFIQYNPDPYIQKMKGKVLALNGSRDIQVASNPNLDGWRRNLAKSKAIKWDVIELQGLNHLFQHCTKCTVAEYAELEETIAPEALQAVSDWLDRNVK